MPATDALEPGRFGARPDISSAASRLRWRLNRLRCMTPAEIRHRVMRMLWMHAERAGVLGTARVPALRIASPADSWMRCPPEVDPAPYLAALRRTGRFPE